MKKKFAFLLIAAILITFASCGEVSSELPMPVDDSSRMNVSQNEISVPYGAELEDEAEDSAVRDISPEEVLEISSGMSAHNDVSYDNSFQSEEPDCETSETTSETSEESFEPASEYQPEEAPAEQSEDVSEEFSEEASAERSEDVSVEISEPISDEMNDESDEASEPEENIPASFTRQVFRYADGAEVKYWLYTPENPVSGMPFLVYLHGGSGKGNDLELITAVDGFPKYLSDGLISPDAYVIIPQLSADRRGWSDIGTQLIRLIASVVKTYCVDEMKISLTGHSMGGTGAWQLALMYPGTFSCVAPMSGSVTLSQQNIAKLKNIPVWAFVGSADTIVPPESSQRFVEALESAGGNAKITVIDGADHFAVPAAYLDKSIDVIGWLINQTR